ncbi:MAG: 5-(carboxyamino)imidazole ribonucleotide mutase [Candidatus Cellulosilyticum pullistercoris]|uniref:N5-carboxyaminoimidazole ribonucleotide mutase n=1 Tax=Candidatus Cellulosilyticum pullistercoris TaxID=2838521 RepID=A0A9E2NMS6_9FIRM|nr:5-(carboxyamino)imidazole ribonucleotide mutase [Candidatus Cellulosilyticum pullistercoris]
MKVAFVMGSDSDLPVVEKGIKTVKEFGIDVVVRVISAHRTPQAAEEFAKNAEANGIGVIVAAAGKAAHLGGVLAAYTTIPVIGLPIKSSTLDGLDSLLSIVQMPPGIPVATVAIDGAENAGILAVQILALGNMELKEKLKAHKASMAEKVASKDAAVVAKFS